MPLSVGRATTRHNLCLANLLCAQREKRQFLHIWLIHTLQPLLHTALLITTMTYTSEVDFVVQGMTSTTHATLKALEHTINFMLPDLSPNDKGRPCNHVRCPGLAVGALMHLLPRTGPQSPRPNIWAGLGRNALGIACNRVKDS